MMKTQIFHKMKYDLKGHPRSYKTILCQNQSSICVYGPFLVKICMNANIMKTHFFHKCHFYFMENFCDFFYFKTFWPHYNLDLSSFFTSKEALHKIYFLYCYTFKFTKNQMDKKWCTNLVVKIDKKKSKLKWIWLFQHTALYIFILPYFYLFMSCVNLW